MHGSVNKASLGHFIFECKSTRPYVSRPSRTELLENPRLLAKLKAEGKPSVEVPEEFRRKYVDGHYSGWNSTNAIAQEWNGQPNFRGKGAGANGAGGIQRESKRGR